MIQRLEEQAVHEASFSNLASFPAIPLALLMTLLEGVIAVVSAAVRVEVTEAGFATNAGPGLDSIACGSFTVAVELLLEAHSGIQLMEALGLRAI